MKRLLFLFSCFCCFGLFCGGADAEENIEQQPLSKSEADGIVSERMKAREAAETAKREFIEEQPSSGEWETVKRDGSGKKTIYRRLAPPGHQKHVTS